MSKLGSEVEDFIVEATCEIGLGDCNGTVRWWKKGPKAEMFGCDPRGRNTKEGDIPLKLVRRAIFEVVE